MKWCYMGVENELKVIKCPKCNKYVDARQAICTFCGTDLSNTKHESEIELTGAVKEYMEDISKRQQELLKLDEQVRIKDSEIKKVEERLKIRIDAIKSELDRIRIREYKVKQKEVELLKREDDLVKKEKEIKDRLDELEKKEKEFAVNNSKVQTLLDASKKDITDLTEATVDEKLIKIAKYNDEIEAKEEKLNKILTAIKNEMIKIHEEKKSIEEKLYNLGKEKEKNMALLDIIKKKETKHILFSYSKKKTVECPKCGSLNSEESTTCEICEYTLK